MSSGDTWSDAPMSEDVYPIAPWKWDPPSFVWVIELQHAHFDDVYGATEIVEACLSKEDAGLWVEQEYPDAILCYEHTHVVSWKQKHGPRITANKIPVWDPLDPYGT